MIFRLLQRFARTFFWCATRLSLEQGCFDALWGLQLPFSPGCEDTASVVSGIQAEAQRNLLAFGSESVGNSRKSLFFQTIEYSGTRRRRHHVVGAGQNRLDGNDAPIASFKGRILLKSESHGVRRP